MWKSESVIVAMKRVMIVERRAGRIDLAWEGNNVRTQQRRGYMVNKTWTPRWKISKRLPTFNFLGFTCYWGKSRKGFWMLKYTSRKDRFSSKLKGMKRFLRSNLNTPNTPGVIRTVIRVIKGWINYHAVSYNQRRVSQFLWQSRRIIFRWMNRRGGRKRVTWKKFALILKAYSFPTTWKTIPMF